MPTRDKDERPVAQDLQTGRVAAESAVSEHRRKIIKASAAVVPAIMTIRSGAAAAMNSINQCIEEDARRGGLLTDTDKLVWGDDPINEPLDALDEWFRVAVWMVQVKVGNADVNLYGLPESGIVSDNIDHYSKWYDETGSTVDSKNNSSPYTEIVKDKEFDAGKLVYVLAYVDTERPPYPYITWYPKPLEGEVSPITGSCLCSVNPVMG